MASSLQGVRRGWGKFAIAKGPRACTELAAENVFKSNKCTFTALRSVGSAISVLELSWDVTVHVQVIASINR
jgi:hypothetical protein